MKDSINTIYKGNCEEIKELDEEQFNSSIANTDRLENENLNSIALSTQKSNFKLGFDEKTKEEKHLVFKEGDHFKNKKVHSHFRNTFSNGNINPNNSYTRNNMSDDKIASESQSDIFTRKTKEEDIRLLSQKDFVSNLENENSDSLLFNNKDKLNIDALKDKFIKVKKEDENLEIPKDFKHKNKSNQISLNKKYKKIEMGENNSKAHKNQNLKGVKTCSINLTKQKIKSIMNDDNDQNNEKNLISNNSNNYPQIKINLKENSLSEKNFKNSNKAETNINLEEKIEDQNKNDNKFEVQEGIEGTQNFELRKTYPLDNEKIQKTIQNNELNSFNSDTLIYYKTDEIKQDNNDQQIDLPIANITNNNKNVNNKDQHKILHSNPKKYINKKSKSFSPNIFISKNFSSVRYNKNNEKKSKNEFSKSVKNIKIINKKNEASKKSQKNFLKFNKSFKNNLRFKSKALFPKNDKKSLKSLKLARNSDNIVVHNNFVKDTYFITNFDNSNANIFKKKLIQFKNVNHKNISANSFSDYNDNVLHSFNSKIKNEKK